MDTYLRHSPSIINFIRLLHEIDVQASADMPGDVAMERPHAGIVGVVLNDQIPVALDLLHVAALGVGVTGDSAVPCSDALC